MKQRTIIEALQSRIDFNSGEITYHEANREYARKNKIGYDPSKLALLRYNQEQDKRLLGYIIDLHRHLKICHTAASVKWKEDYEERVRESLEKAQ